MANEPTLPELAEAAARAAYETAEQARARRNTGDPQRAELLAESAAYAAATHALVAAAEAAR
ncbi:hypothetical protein [Streptomyces sp. NPDC012450]|uniref:hypothetical protein n=1 Tax=Streptomyces sp. NPDC012450 TaxID=3364834 RepID=UPI0036E1A77D